MNISIITLFMIMFMLIIIPRILHLQSLDIIPDTTGGGKVPQLHLEWCETIDKLKETMELTHRCHCYLLARVWHRDVSHSLFCLLCPVAAVL